MGEPTVLRSQIFAGDTKLEAAAISDPAHITQGAAGQHVVKIQQALIQLDGAIIDPDELQSGRYGPSTAKAVLAYKRKRHIINRRYETTADDIVGRMTMAALDEEMLKHEHDNLALAIEGPFLLHHPLIVYPPQAQMMLHFGVPASAQVQQIRRRRPPGPRPAPVNFPITDTPNMPPISFRCNVHGAAPALVAKTAFRWELAVNYNSGTCHSGTKKDGSTRSTNLTHHETVIGDNFIPFFPKIRGGSFTAKCSCTINGRVLRDHLSISPIGGTNPLRRDIFAALPNDILRKMCLHESGGRQFLAPAEGGIGICPLWSNDRQLGVGLFQLTVPPPTDDEVWNWRSNASGAIKRFEQLRKDVQTYPGRVRSSHRFQQLVRDFNRHTTIPGGPVQIHLPEFTPEQIDLDAIRGFNGFAGRDHFGNVLHEFRVALDEHGRLRVQNVELDGPSAQAIWERVPAAARPQDTGDPNYVNNVLAQQL
jgi:hypothetical protein